MNGGSLKKLKVLALPYRDYWYSKKYGATVRDLAMLDVLARHPLVAEVVAVCRPRLLYEPFDFACAKKRRIVENFVLWEVSRSHDLLGPLKRRRWTEFAYENVLKRSLVDFQTQSSETINVFLDFHPIANVDKFLSSFGDSFFYWYDLIDNFKKHNRYKDSEISVVEKKYDSVRRQARLVTGVTKKAIDTVRCESGIVIPNCQFLSNIRVNENFTGEFEFGFLGFVTNKFDIDFVREIVSQGKKIIIAGEVLDAGISEELKKLEGVKLIGRFHQNQIDEIVSRFAIGVIPYREARSHDGSPLKAYQYLSSGRAVISNMMYELDGKWIAADRCFVGKSIQELVARAFCLMEKSFSEYARDVVESYPEDATWESKINFIVKKIIELSDEN
jgi:hypothetical protein